MQYVTYDTNGVLTGAFWQDLNPEHEANHIEVDVHQYAQWVTFKANAARNGLEVAPVPAPTTEQVIADVTACTQKRLDDFARTRNYDGILSACTYNLSSVAKFASEGQYCIDARDATWATLYEFMAEVQLGNQPMPAGYADVEPLLPPLAWPV